MSHDKVWPEYPIEPEQLSLEDLNDPEFAIFEKELKSLELDNVALPESGVYFDALEARIMGALDAAIESGEVSNREKPQSKIASIASKSAASAAVVAQTMKRRRSVGARAGQFALLAGVAFVTTGKVTSALTPFLSNPKVSGKAVNAASLTTPSSTEAGAQLSATHQAAPKVLTGTVIGFESDSDLAIEIAARRMVAYHNGK